MSSPARKPAPRREAVVLRLLTWLVFFGCASAHVVSYAASEVGAVGLDEHARTQHVAACLHDEALPTDDLNASEVEPPEPDAALGGLPFRFTDRATPQLRLADPAPHVVRVDAWLPRAVVSNVMAQGPP